MVQESGKRNGLSGAKVLVAEDEYTIAMFLVDFLEMKDVQVIGPAGNLKDLGALLDSNSVDAALLDINLGGELVYPLADRLREQGVPFLLTSGYDDNVPERFISAPRCAKPYRLEALARALEDTLAQGAAPAAH